MEGLVLDVSKMLLNYGIIAVPAITAAVLVGCGNNSSGSKRNDKSVKREVNSGKIPKSNKSTARHKKASTTSKRSVSARSQSSKSASKRSSKKKSSSSKSHRKSLKKSVRAKSASVANAPKSAVVPATQKQQPPSATSMKTSVSMKKSDSVKAPSANEGMGVTTIHIGADASGILKLIPPNLRFNNRQSETLEVILKNQSKEFIAIKAKCSDNQIYRVDPVYTVLKPEQSIKVSVHREATPFKIDKLVFAVLKVPKGSGNARDAFSAIRTSVQETLFVLPLFTTAAPSAFSALSESISQKHFQSVENPAPMKNMIGVQ